MKETLTRLRERVRHHTLLNNVWRVGVFTVGATVLAAGVAMLVFPGPGWAAIFVGFAILATEFAWAQAVLRWTKDRVDRAKDKALDPADRRRNTLIAVVAGVVVAAGVVIYLAVFGLSLPWS